MGLYFTADEVLQIAERIEENGVRFYRQAAERATASDVRALLLRLAGDEEKHRLAFGGMRAQLGASEKPAFTLAPSDDAAGYLKALADLVLFPPDADPVAEIGIPLTCRSVLMTAVQKERDSVAYYAGLRQIVPKTFGKMKVDAIIREEMRHVSQLAGELAALKD